MLWNHKIIKFRKLFNWPIYDNKKVPEINKQSLPCLLGPCKGLFACCLKQNQENQYLLQQQ